MAWKPKEKPLTEAEAISLAKSQLSRYWFNSSPLLAGIKVENEFKAFPLDPAFPLARWLLLFVDPTNYSGEALMRHALEWDRRYSAHHLTLLLVFGTPYEFVCHEKWMQRLIHEAKIDFPAVVDFDGGLSGAFGIEEFPRVMLLNQGKRVLDRVGKSWNDGTELEIQRFLRTTDPGLPLPPVFRSGVDESHFRNDQARIEFGSGAAPGIGARFPAPGFQAGPDGTRKVGQFMPPALVRKPLPGEVILSGEWFQEKERIITSDPMASLEFLSTAPNVSIIAQSVSKRVDPAKVVVEVNGSPVHEEIAGEGIFMEEDGRSGLHLIEEDVHRTLVNLPSQERHVMLRFPSANMEAVALFGLRFGE